MLRRLVWPGRMLPILCYHYFGFDRIPEAGILPHDSAYITPVELFAAHLDFLTARRIPWLRPTSLMTGSPAETGCWLTIDDGHRSILTHAFPLLEKRSIPATIFVIPERVGASGYLSYEEIRSLIRTGLISVGSHGLSHRLLTKLPDAEIRHELQASRAILEDELNCEITIFAVPMGGYTSRVGRLAESAGYRLVLTSDYGLNHPFRPNRLQRLMMKAPIDSIDNLSAQLSGGGLLPLELRARNLLKAFRNRLP